MIVEHFEIGEYSLQRDDDGTFWIINLHTQEGGEFSEDKLAKAIEKFWKDEF